MYARVAKWEGGSPDALRQSAKELKTEVESGPPPEGLPAIGMLMLVDPDGGRCIAISMFETEEDLRQGDAKLNTMSPRTDMGHRAAVESYEVAVDVRM